MDDGMTLYAQLGILYTDIDGLRKFRVINYQWKVASNALNYYLSADVENVAQFKIRGYIANVSKLGAKATKEKVINDLIDLLTNYRKDCASHTSISTLALPETLKLLPLYILSAMKLPALKLLNMTGLD